MTDVVKRKNGRYICWDVYHTRGDNGYVELDLIDANGFELVPADDDIIRVQVRREPNGGELLFEGEVLRDDLGRVIWRILPDNTSTLDPDTYYWDAELVPRGDEDYRITFIPVSQFIVIDEVTQAGGK